MNPHIVIRSIATCAVLLTIVGATANTKSDDPFSQPTAEEMRLTRALAKSIYQIIPEEKEHFELRYANPDNPAFFSDSSNGFEQVRCEQLAAIDIINQQGRIGVAKCKNGPRVRELATRSGAMTEQRLKELGLKLDDTSKALVEHTRELLSDGSEYHYLTVFAAGHGLMLVSMGVLYDKKTNSAVVIQANLDKLCTDVKTQKLPPACVNLLRAFKQLAQNMLAVP
jgi:hypothetical protein